MSYLKLYFGKEATELTYEDLENYFKEEKDESNKIEYKSYVDEFGKNNAHKEKVNGVLKTISGLLNSEGGLIIWGAPKGKTDETESKRKIFVGELSPVTMFIEKDSFINKVTDSITPSPNGIQFYPFQKGNNYVYIIEVERSSYSPHQFKNGYFMRLDGQTVPAPHHYIEALFKKTSYPRLEGYIRIDDVKIVDDLENLKEVSMTGKGASSACIRKYEVKFSYFVFNHSKLQNEHDLFCKINITHGNFQVPFAQHKTSLKQFPTKQEMIVNPAKTILFYGDPFCDVQKIDFPIFKPDEKLIFRLYFYFGGKSSPMKVSEYKIKLNNSSSDKNFNDLYEFKHENLPLFESDEYSFDKEKDLLKVALGR
jgi:hypothetical protein